MNEELRRHACVACMLDNSVEKAEVSFVVWGGDSLCMTHFKKALDLIRDTRQTPVQYANALRLSGVLGWTDPLLHAAPPPWRVGDVPS